MAEELFKHFKDFYLNWARFFTILQNPPWWIASVNGIQ